MDHIEKEPKVKSQDTSAKTREEQFDEGVERVYRKYGSDLDAFVRDFQREAIKVHR